MTTVRKVCLYKNCNYEPGHTFFKFPVEHDRFKVWCVNAGLAFQGDVDITKARYLCEKHFSTNYISNQARRKMLVHTAIPFPYKDTEDNLKDPKFNIVGEPPAKKKKFSEYSVSQLASKPKVEKPAEIVMNEEVVEESAEEEPEIMLSKHSDEDTYEIEEVLKHKPATNTRTVVDVSRNQIFKEITLKPQVRPQVQQYVFVKPKPKTVKTVVTTQKIDEQQLMLIEELPELSSASLNVSEESIEEFTVESPPKSVKSPPKAEKQQEPLESYSEFIFNGEKYVQMPKRVFEAEKEKLRKETEKYKTLLSKLKNFVNKIEIN